MHTSGFEVAMKFAISLSSSYRGWPLQFIHQARESRSQLRSHPFHETSLSKETEIQMNQCNTATLKALIRFCAPYFLSQIFASFYFVHISRCATGARWSPQGTQKDPEPTISDSCFYVWNGRAKGRTRPLPHPKCQMIFDPELILLAATWRVVWLLWSSLLSVWTNLLAHICLRELEMVKIPSGKWYC